MIVYITDDFSLSRIARSGQCFRVKEFPSGIFRFIFKNSVLYISEVEPYVFDVSCDNEEWNSIWHHYFDLDTSYEKIRNAIDVSDAFLLKAAEVSKGVRVLRQDPWEMLITFIISQQKSIPAIKKSIEMLCAACGTPYVTPLEELFVFPSAESIIAQSDDTLISCKLGYRLPYIKDAAQKVFSDSVNLEALHLLPDEDLLRALKSISGVGDKVANCVSLFGYHRTASVPIDVWIKRIITQSYNGINPFPKYGENAGIMQQFAFYYAQNYWKR